MDGDLNKLFKSAQPLINAPKRQPVGNGNSAGKGLTNKGIKSRSKFALPEVTPEGDYMGMAFDAAVRKGKDAARAYLLDKMKRDGRTDAFIQGKLKEFDNSIGKQTSLSKDKGLGEGMEKVYREAAQSNNQPTLAQAKQLRDARKSVGSVFGDSARQKTQLATERNLQKNSQGPTKFDSGASTPY